MPRALPPPTAVAESLTQHCGLRIESGRLIATPTANLTQARSLIVASLAPAADRIIAGQLAIMSALVARRAGSAESADVTLAAFVQRLREYPADIVAAVLQDWPNKSQWWPTWFELRAELEPRTATRRAWLRDLDHIERIANSPRIAPDPDAEARITAAAEAEHNEVSVGLRQLVAKLKGRMT